MSILFVIVSVIKYELISSSILQKNKPANWILHKPQLPISYGTHHSKAMILVYPKGVRIIVHTANLIHTDWNYKSQGLWMQDFPWKSQDCLHAKSPFENDLVDYISVLKVIILQLYLLCSFFPDLLIYFSSICGKQNLT